MLALALLALQGTGSWQAALEEGDFRKAWQQVQALGGGAEGARAEARILYQAGDPAAAWRAARRGLELSPGDLELHFFSAGSALWLGEPDAAREATVAFAGAVERAALSSEDRPAWEQSVGEFALQAETLTRAELARGRALFLARASALGGLAAAVCLLFLLTRGLQRGSASGHA